MTDEQFKTIVKLLTSINQKLDDIESSTSSTFAAVVDVDNISRDLKEIKQSMEE
jgi:hypothetical protein